MRAFSRVLAGSLCGGLAVAQAGVTPEARMQACRALSTNEARLACYDTIVLPAETAELARGNNDGQDFDLFLDRPGVLLLEHDDAILVGSLQSGAGEILRNLHLAGSGRLRVPIIQPGHYRVRVTATGRWVAKLGPAPED